MMPKKPRLTEDQKLRRRAARKAAATNAKLKADAGPLFEHEIPKAEFVTPEQQYWKYRADYACEGGKGNAAGYLYSVNHKVDVFICRMVAKRAMRAEDFAIADNKRWVGDVLKFWKDVLTGQKQMVLGYDRISHGWKPCFRGERPTPPVCCEHGCRYCERVILCYVEVTDIVPTLTWPPAGWLAPLTSDGFDQLTAIPPAYEFGCQVDPLGLGGLP
jgi:hypothetical protein